MSFDGTKVKIYWLTYNFGAKFVVFLLFNKRKTMRYLRLFPALLLGTMLTACSTTKSLYEAQQYDEVIQRVAPAICDGDLNAKQINYVAASYHKANQADHERIQALKASGQPDVWPEIYQRYCSMKGRNEALSCFPTKVKNGMNYVKLDLDDDMTVARNHAEAFLVAKANQLLGTGSKADAMEAENYIQQLARTNRDNVNLLNLRKKQALCLAEKVTIGISDERDLPTPVAHAVLDFSEGEVPFALVHSKAYAAMVVVNIDELEVSPIRLDEVTFEETREGKTVSVTDHSQTKNAKMKGSLAYYDIDGRRIGAVPFEVTSTFKNDYTTIKGDREACSTETLGRLDSHPVPVPTDESLMLDAAKKLNYLIAIELKK